MQGFALLLLVQKPPSAPAPPPLPQQEDTLKPQRRGSHISWPLKLLWAVLRTPKWLPPAGSTSGPPLLCWIESRERHHQHKSHFLNTEQPLLVTDVLLATWLTEALSWERKLNRQLRQKSEGVEGEGEVRDRNIREVGKSRRRNWDGWSHLSHFLLQHIPTMIL